VLEVQAGINQPRYASLKGIMQAKRKPVEKVGTADLGLEAAEVGAAGSRVEVLSVQFPDTGGGAQMLEGDPATVAAELVLKLQKEARVL
jgi:electron transfer flavoprotein beta subunit